MSKLTEHASYLRGLAEGTNLTPGKNKKNKLLTEMLEVLEDLAQETVRLSDRLSDIADFAEDIDNDLAEAEELLCGEGCCCGEDGCCEDEECCECEDDGMIHFQCPNCGKPVSMKTEAVEQEKSPVCEYCGEPFFIDVEEDEETLNEEAALDGIGEASDEARPDEQ